jgi:DNA polymerase II small subunit
MLDIVHRLAESGYQIDPEALDMIGTYRGTTEDLVNQILSNIDGSVVVIRAKHISSCLSRSNGLANLSVETIKKSCVPISLANSEEDFNDTRLNRTTIKDTINHLAEKSSCSGIEVDCDITGNSTCVGEYEDFVRYFRDRYSKIREILARRLNARPIESLGKNMAGREVSLIGMVMDVRTTAKGHRVLELEDPTGMIAAIIQKDSDLFSQSSYIIPDEVLGITAVSDGNGRVFVKSILWPDMPNQCGSLDTGSGIAVLTSDLHIGSKYFMEEAWERFVSWLNGEADDPSGLALQVKYLVIAGDLVDGIGIYPGQEGDLKIRDIYEQYETAGQFLGVIRKDVQIIISPGNHDIVRQAEPQPALPESVQKFFSSNNHFVGDPAWVTLEGASLLVYHGRSIDDLVMRVPGLSYNEPEKAMVEMLRRRHLSPIYGGRVSIAPEHQDHYVIHKPPSILHCGHVHTVGIARYKGVAAINSGTWQSQTDFQKKMNIQPTPATVPIVDLATMKVRKLLFA